MSSNTYAIPYTVRNMSPVDRLHRYLAATYARQRIHASSRHSRRQPFHHAAPHIRSPLLLLTRRSRHTEEERLFSLSSPPDALK